MNVVVVGGGFAGVKAALELAKRQVGKITLISDEPYFLHHATLYATATGKNTAESVISLKDIFAEYPHVTVVDDKITSIDPARRLIISTKKQYKYDEAILALGSVTTYFGIKGMQQHAYGIKSLSEIHAFKEHIHSELVHKKLDKEYFVIGAGPTGVELAAALQEYLQYLITAYRLPARRVKITLVEAAPRILPHLSETAAKKVATHLDKLGIRVLVNHRVMALSKDAITIEGQKIHTKTAIWTSGVANNPFFDAHQDVFHLAKDGRVNVSTHLEAAPHVYVIGDNSTAPFSGTAWQALAQAKYVAKDLARIHTKQPRVAYHPRRSMVGVPVGQDWGYVEAMNLYVAGRTGAFARRLMELHSYTQLIKYRKAVALWRAHDIPHVDA